jgi:hypothetical protein
MLHIQASCRLQVGILRRRCSWLASAAVDLGLLYSLGLALAGGQGVDQRVHQTKYGI